jgi:acyl carrier protein
VISVRLKKVILAELRLDDFQIEAGTLAQDVPGWDSLSHLQILSGVEKEFSIRFASLEIMRLKNIGELQALVDRKMATRK